MAGRRHKYQEFLHTLKDILEVSDSELAKVCGKKAPNMSKYLSGKLRFEKRAARSAVEHLSQWNVLERQTLAPLDVRHISTQPGIYVLYDSSGLPVYLGQAANLRVEVSARLSSKKTRYKYKFGQHLKARTYSIKKLAHYVSTYEVKSQRLRDNLEAFLIRCFPNSIHNKHNEHFK